MCDCFGSDSDKPEVTEAVAQVNDTIDSFTQSMLNDELNNAIKQRDKGFNPNSIIEFPAPYDDIESRTDIHCFDGSVPAAARDKYTIPSVDEFYGDLNVFDDLCYYGKYSDGIFGHSFDDNGDPPSKADWDTIGLGSDATTEARNYYQGTIAKALYNVEDINALQRDEKGNAPQDNVHLKYKQLNDWEVVDIKELKDKNQVLTALLGDEFVGDKVDIWLTLIAFTGYGAHRTAPFESNQEHQGAFFVNDITFLGQYAVRSGFERYGAAAYFDKDYNLMEIFLSESNRTYKKPDGKGGGSTQGEWQHAKWAWKVSLSVAIFLVDNLAHARFREMNGLVTCIQTYLNSNHPLRRLLLPFTLGTVYANRVFNEFLRENGPYHRCFAFKYVELQRLIRESMDDAPPKTDSGQQRSLQDQMKYRFRLIRKKVQVMQKLPDAIYPIYTDVYDFWVQSLIFVEEYIEVFYNSNDTDDRLLEADTEAKAFYEALCETVGVGGRFRLKKFNIINILTHFICTATVWCHHLNTAVSFEYSVDPDFTGTKIVGNYSKQNNISSYVEYCLLVMTMGWKYPNLMDTNEWKWNIVLSGDKISQTSKVFKKYFDQELKNQSERVKLHNRDRIAPYYAIDPRFCQSSVML